MNESVLVVVAKRGLHCMQCRSAGRNLSTPLARSPTNPSAGPAGFLSSFEITKKLAGQSIKRSAGETRSKNATR